MSSKDLTFTEGKNITAKQYHCEAISLAVRRIKLILKGELMKKTTANLLPFENHLPEEVTFPLDLERGKTQSHENRLVFAFDEKEAEGINDTKA